MTRLQTLEDHILDPSKVLLNKRLFNVNHSAESINTHCTDGSSYHGDIIAGADGVLSKVLEIMQHYPTWVAISGKWSQNGCQMEPRMGCQWSPNGSV